MDWSTEYMGLSSQFNFAMNTFPGPPLTSGPAAHHTDPSMGNWSSPLEQNQLFENGIAVDPAANATTTSMWDSSPFMGNSRPDQSALAAAATPHAATSVGYWDPSMESTSTFAASTISPTSITTHAAAATTMGAWAPSMVSSRESVNRWNQAIAPAKQGNSFPGSMWAPHPSVEFSPSRMADCHAAADRTVYGFVDLSNDLADAAAARGAGVPQTPSCASSPRYSTVSWVDASPSAVRRFKPPKARSAVAVSPPQLGKRGPPEPLPKSWGELSRWDSLMFEARILGRTWADIAELRTREGRKMTASSCRTRVTRIEEKLGDWPGRRLP
ncbi:hypothetical protein N7468_004834 [Penicillium chermesinum]|uniref:Uncharacterized protein n=1 Tax=Penicillium chermesinum TaxID=63820 RepID=A0A9W9P9A6_9EURO|nr:uncharacterized protein N7468_004834 [Penicillium chermesinum]KAJ5240215.1 hypothetical protein N7468_004834 [Penicillium chermesinum]